MLDLRINVIRTGPVLKKPAGWTGLQARPAQIPTSNRFWPVWTENQRFRQKTGGSRKKPVYFLQTDGSIRNRPVQTKT